MTNERFDTYIVAKVLAAYLIEGKSHRWIQREILGLPAPARGGGFITMTILHSFNIKGDDKGLLKNNLENLMQIDTNAKEIIESFIEFQDEAQNLIERKPINPKKNKTERFSQIKTRVYQDILKKYVAQNYQHQCALCDIDQPELLVASHIIPWSTDESKRLDLDNCILFCSIHDKLFDKGFIAFDGNLNLIVSDNLSKRTQKYVVNLSFKKPLQCSPNVLYLQTHFEEIFRK